MKKKIRRSNPIFSGLINPNLKVTGKDSAATPQGQWIRTPYHFGDIPALAKRVVLNNLVPRKENAQPCP